MQIVIILFLILYAAPQCAAMDLNLSAAERILLQNNLDLKAKRVDLEKADADVLTSGLLPNPSFRYHVESVNNGSRDTEQSYTVSQSFDIVPKRGLRVEAALKRKEAARLLFEREVSNSLLQLRQSYYRLLLLRENVRAAQEVVDVLSDIEAKTAERVKAGDAAEADLMKLTAEKSRFRRDLDSLRAELTAERGRLALMLNLEDGEFEVVDTMRYVPATVAPQVMTAAALEKRPDLTARAALTSAAETSLALSKRESVAPLEVEAGYKTQTGGFEGYVLGVTVPLPLFDRNQGKTKAAAAELESERLTYQFLRRAVQQEVRVLYDRLTFLSRRVTGLSEQLRSSQEISRIARASYEEGETGLIDLFDAFRSEKEVLRDYHTAVYEYQVTLFELERATGTNLRDARGVK